MSCFGKQDMYIGNLSFGVVQVLVYMCLEVAFPMHWLSAGWYLPVPLGYNIIIIYSLVSRSHAPSHEDRGLVPRVEEHQWSPKPHREHPYELRDIQPRPFNHNYCRGVVARSIHLMYSNDRKLGRKRGRGAKTYPKQHHSCSTLMPIPVPTPFLFHTDAHSHFY